MPASQPAHLIEEAKGLLGRSLIRQLNGEQLAGTIVEVELYHEQDPASHSFKRKSDRNSAMFLPRNHAYVYRSYGIHYCLNVTAGEQDEGAAILIRALQPLTGIETMASNRLRKRPSATWDKKMLCSGPGKTTQALGIDLNLNSHSLDAPPLQISSSRGVIKPNEIVTTTRIGISQAREAPLRFYLRGNEFISKK